MLSDIGDANHVTTWLELLTKMNERAFTAERRDRRSVPTECEPSDIIGLGLILFVCIAIIVRTKKRVVKNKEPINRSNRDDIELV